MTSSEFSRYDSRVIIKFLNKLQLTPAEIHAEMVKVIGVKYSPSVQTVRKWVREFKEGRSECIDLQRLGRPASVRNTKAIHSNQGLTLRGSVFNTSELSLQHGRLL